MKMNKYLPILKDKEIEAKSQGYRFKLYDASWQLDKNNNVSLFYIHKYLSGETLKGCLKTLAFFGSYYSAAYTKNLAQRLEHMLKITGAQDITVSDLINYRASLCEETEWYLSVIRILLRRWYKMGYHGISADVIRLLDGWRLKGNRHGDAVKRKDPNSGPLTDNELQAFNEGAVRAYELGMISLKELGISLSVSNTGRRPIQISHLCVMDISYGKNQKEEPFYILNVPRAKQGSGFRNEFKPFAITQELWAVLSAQAKNAIASVEQQLGFELQETDRQQVPLFPDLKFVQSIGSPSEYRQEKATDRLHVTSAEITDTLQFVVEVANIQSERTGDLLEINARRFRYTTGTRTAREGFGELVIADLLDHNDTQHAGVYVKNIPEHIERLDEAIGFQLAPYAQAFSGVLVDSEKDAERGGDFASRIRTEEGSPIGSCGEYGFCGANVPVPCYTCAHFQPWLDGPHDDVYQSLLSERERTKEITGDIEIASVLDRTIVAVADVIMRCNQRRSELKQEGGSSGE